MSNYFGSDDIAKLTRAARLEREEMLKIQQEENVEKKRRYTPPDILDIKLNILKEYAPIFFGLFEVNIENAILETEYSRHSKFATKILKVIKDNLDDILYAAVIRGLGGAIIEMERVAGDMSDFVEGVEQARELLEFKLSGSPMDRAKFWRTHVWPNDELYDQTISTRFSAWGELAPYWILMEYGNMGKKGAYPTFSPTNFFSSSINEIITKINGMADLALEKRNRDLELPEPEIEEKYDKKEITLFDEAQRRLQQSPESYEPGYIFSTFMNLETQREYEIYLTKTRKIGKKLLYR